MRFAPARPADQVRAMDLSLHTINYTVSCVIEPVPSTSSACLATEVYVLMPSFRTVAEHDPIKDYPLAADSPEDDSLADASFENDLNTTVCDMDVNEPDQDSFSVSIYCFQIYFILFL